MDAIITYDIESEKSDNSKNDEVKNGMKDLGYLDQFDTTNKNKKKVVCYLPNTTLWKSNTSPEKALQDLHTVAKEVNATIERAFADEFTANWRAIPGMAFHRL